MISANGLDTKIFGLLEKENKFFEFIEYLSLGFDEDSPCEVRELVNEYEYVLASTNTLDTHGFIHPYESIQEV